MRHAPSQIEDYSKLQSLLIFQICLASARRSMINQGLSYPSMNIEEFESQSLLGKYKLKPKLRVLIFFQINSPSPTFEYLSFSSSWVHFFGFYWCKPHRVKKVDVSSTFKCFISDNLIYLGHEDSEEKVTLESLSIMMREVQITVNTILAKMTETAPLPPFSSKDDLVKYNQLAKVISLD